MAARSGRCSGRRSSATSAWTPTPRPTCTTSSRSQPPSRAGFPVSRSVTIGSARRPSGVGPQGECGEKQAMEQEEEQSCEEKAEANRLQLWEAEEGGESTWQRKA